MAKFKIEPPYYPIIYVRGYAMTASEREDVFHDAYYGFGITSVEKREAPPPRYFEADLFEGLLIRLIKDHRYIDSTNQGLEDGEINPARSIWVSRFYDNDYFKQSVRSIEEHAREVCELISKVRERLVELEVDVSNYKVILLAHSMGGLVCRALIQKEWPEYAAECTKRDKNKAENPDPKNIIHRLVTMGTPHGGIDLGAIPDFVEDRIVTKYNPAGSSIFKEDRMRSYLDLEQLKSGKKKTKNTKPEDYLYDVHSLGPDDRFPIKRCLCLIGSDWSSYGLVRKLTGGVSDGLVKQSRAYIVSGPRPDIERTEDNPTPEYNSANLAFWANVHRAHSGYRGIVNSYESYENIQRFLFGNRRFDIRLDNVQIKTARVPGDTYIYDFEFMLSIRGTATYLHRRQQDPCENAIRIKLDDDKKKPPKSIPMHTGFMNTVLRAKGSQHSHFRLMFQIVERHIKKGYFWDKDYPASNIYSETLEARVNSKGLQYRWLSDLSAGGGEGWQDATVDGTAFRAKMRPAATFDAELVVQSQNWPDPKLTLDG